ncbi:Endopeptidase La [Elusimicrobium minutum Pei191]|uniref:Lon protease n=1 Tax=Elusimicrobium minutum (strain Pei191) TaxID=445932 RepID=LON_ELUMP|nr:endopeptidase La [Elusimicrobium minutum]B2KCC0.1 RecName: Full=Lon protease; AltName: Full=ATP-dependent protease La [Elusimicrobium minutum Pei191]ACC98041.1 Endopeptidase La [Elusimicrobium minutum Pei191]
MIAENKDYVKPDVNTLPAVLPAVAIRDVVMFPGMSLPLSVSRSKSIAAINLALDSNKYVVAVAQKEAEVEDPKAEDIYRFGVLSEITQSLKMPDGSIKVFLQGIARVKIEHLDFNNIANSWFASVFYPADEKVSGPEVTALMRQLLDEFEEYATVSRRIAVEGVSFFRQIEDPSRLADTIASNIIVKTSDRQDVLEAVNPKDRLELLIKILANEVEIISLEEKIHSKVRAQIEKNQKEYYLNEQMKAIQKELSQKDDFQKEIDELRSKIKKNGLPKNAKESAEKELDRLAKMAPFSPESTVSRTYLDWLVNMPWNSSTNDILDLKKAKEVMDADHYGLDKPKERILEYLAVSKLTNSLKGPILCFAGPPGVGKTSLAKSIASAVGRKFVRMSLGGVRDESEIRGHRRTYIGSMPGRIIQGISKAKSNNPVFLLDEIDKMGSDWRGDPAAALLELLDPEQNKDFSDHYLDVPFDVSKVMFITTANSLSSIPVTLRDRLEIIDFSGYTEYEKEAIAQNHLIPRQMKEHGLKEGSLEIGLPAVKLIMRDYVREAGVRNFEREISTICRKAAKMYVENCGKTVTVTKDNLHDFLGVPRYTNFTTEENGVGISTGLAWTSVGGETLSIEASEISDGKGRIMLTGKLGDVMKESVHAALTYARSKGYGKGIDFNKTDFHIHFPEGAVPKDGPSAGTAVTTALISLLTKNPVKKNLAMTGEVTITGRVLPIGGVKEKFMAAYREGVKTILYPHTNEKDVSEVPEVIRKQLKLIPVKHMDEIVKIAFEKGEPKSSFKKSKTAPKKESAKKAAKSKKPAVKKPAVKKTKQVKKTAKKKK